MLLTLLQSPAGAITLAPPRIESSNAFFGATVVNLPFEHYVPGSNRGFIRHGSRPPSAAVTRHVEEGEALLLILL